MDNPVVMANNIPDDKLKKISLKILSSERISSDEGCYLYKHAELGFLGLLAEEVKQRYNGNKVFFNRNIHIEPTNICIYQCRFCSYSRKKGETGSWELNQEEIINLIRLHVEKKITEVHIVGGVHPDRGLEYYETLLKKIKKEFPEIHIKGFTAVELDYMITKAGVTLREGLKRLKASGLDSIPGGGAEIFDPSIRRQLCSEKISGEKWLEIHREAHRIGLPSNATMLYGHLENYEQRISHLEKLRALQDETQGFNAFIPLKFRKANNAFSHLYETTVVDDLKNYAICRIFLDNFPHIKAYWPMIGKDMAQLALSFGADDIDGTIEDTTKIYSMAGVKDSNSMTAEEMATMITSTGRIAVERDSLYNELRKW